MLNNLFPKSFRVRSSNSNAFDAKAKAVKRIFVSLHMKSCENGLRLNKEQASRKGYAGR